MSRVVIVKKGQIKMKRCSRVGSSWVELSRVGSSWVKLNGVELSYIDIVEVGQVTSLD